MLSGEAGALKNRTNQVRRLYPLTDSPPFYRADFVA
jgi:hypothetical protein